MPSTKEMYGYYDLFLINPDGYVFYTVAKEPDYQTNLVNGKYSNSNLGSLVKEVLNMGQFGFVDFKPYAPSNGEPAAFIAQPVMHNGEAELVVGLQISLESINSIMQEREGMGKTGETYLVGSDNLMRSDSFLDPANHSVMASFANPDKGRVDTDASKEALAGKVGEKIVIDYNGNPVLSAYTPIKIGNTTWAMMAEIDEQEVVSDSEAARNLTRRVYMIAIISLIVVAAVILMSIFIVRNLSGTLKRVAENTNDVANQVASASAQVSSSSQQLAEGASEQAASLEETSSSLEEMASMTKQNADNARQADSLIKEASLIVSNANDSMSEVDASMAEISKASEETSKIIKTIDEIAFQTNLLALNAAVEAARAGEVGAGFAVVADEVRNLAMRAADAAKNTADLIEGTVKRVKSGSEVVVKTNDAFGKVVESTKKVSELVGEISAASNEQAEGIEQVNTAMNQMDRVVQSSAATAEESAAASEELTAQAENMRDVVTELTRMVSGNGSNNHPDSVDYREVKTDQPRQHEVITTPKGSASVKKEGQEIKLTEIIPMDDDFKDF